jgi:hypothetical protein
MGLNGRVETCIQGCGGGPLKRGYLHDLGVDGEDDVKMNIKERGWRCGRD